MKLLFEIDKKDYEPNGKAFVRPSARAIIIKAGKLAAIYSQRNGFYKIPGGGIEPGEDSISAMIREVKEEIGYTVIPASVREFGYVHRIQKGRHEPVFIQDNYYYLCDVEDAQGETAFSEQEKKEGFIPVWVDLTEAIRVNEAYAQAHPEDAMIQRELQVLMLAANSQEV